MTDTTDDVDLNSETDTGTLMKTRRFALKAIGTTAVGTVAMSGSAAAQSHSSSTNSEDSEDVPPHFHGCGCGRWCRGTAEGSGRGTASGDGYMRPTPPGRGRGRGRGRNNGDDSADESPGEGDIDTGQPDDVEEDEDEDDEENEDENEDEDSDEDDNGDTPPEESEFAPQSDIVIESVFYTDDGVNPAIYLRNSNDELPLDTRDWTYVTDMVRERTDFEGGTIPPGGVLSIRPEEGVFLDAANGGLVLLFNPAGEIVANAGYPADPNYSPGGGSDDSPADGSDGTGDDGQDTYPVTVSIEHSDNTPASGTVTALSHSTNNEITRESAPDSPATFDLPEGTYNMMATVPDDGSSGEETITVGPDGTEELTIVTGGGSGGSGTDGDQNDVDEDVPDESGGDAETDDGDANEDESDASTPAGEIEGAVHEEINAFRDENGLSELESSEELTDVARSHSEDMAEQTYFSHTTPEGAGPGDRLDDAGVEHNAWAENIAYEFDPGFESADVEDVAESIVDGWVESEGHRGNILGDYDQQGIGVAISDGEIFATELLTN